jgi:glutathione S-transferase
MRREDAVSPALKLWQAEWCLSSHRVRQRLTELGLAFVAHQVPVERSERRALRQATGDTTIPALEADGAILIGEEAILTHLNRHFAEPADAQQQRAKAIKAKQKELEQACPEFTATATR